MNTNEVLANRALEILGAPKGSYKAISPNSHVNMAQSTNDAFPTGVHIATLDLLKEMLGELRNLRDVFREGVFPVGQTDPASESKTAGRVDVPFWIGSEKRYFLSGRLTAGATGPAPTAPPAGK
jgi:aspartate ammonia-lyase